MPSTMRECPSCAVWTCTRCGWKRHSANPQSEVPHDCARCGSTTGTLRPSRHGRHRWAICNDTEGDGNA